MIWFGVLAFLFLFEKESVMESANKKAPSELRLLLAVFLGVLLGAIGISLALIVIDYASHHWNATTEWKHVKSVTKNSPQDVKSTWPPKEFLSRCSWVYLKVDENGWSTGPVGTYQDLDNLWDRANTSEVTEIAIPIFPSVYTPCMCDKLYYDYLLESEIQPGDKVLVIGTGSGADAWMASLKSKSTVFVVEINPQAVVNAKTTARLANFQIDAIEGNAIEVDLPERFKDFDFVLWNMPFIHKVTSAEKFKEANYHDGDDGTILKKFLALLPALLKEDGKAIVLNMAAAQEYISMPGVVTKTYPEDTLGEEAEYMLFLIPNPA